MTDARDIAERRYLLQKRGLYYRPDRCGYTGIKDHAGRYFQGDAIHPDVVAIHEDEAPDFSPSCHEDLARQHLQEQNTSLRKQLEQARDNALEEAAEVVEASKVQEHIAVLAPEIAKIINNGFGEVAQLIRKLKGMTNG